MWMRELVEAIRHHSGLTDDEIIAAGKAEGQSLCAGFACLPETERFYNDNEASIWELLGEVADEQGKTLHDLIGSLPGRYKDVLDFKDRLARFALAEAGRWLEQERL